VLNGNPNLISASVFSAVPGTGGEWLTGQFRFNTTDVPVGQANILINTKNIFHMGLIDGNDGGASYGYFSDFAALNLGADKVICGGSVRLDAGIGKDTYLWSNGSTGQTIDVSESGTYWVRTTLSSCVLTDTIVVTNNIAKVDLGTDAVICTGQKKLLEATTSGATYKWQDGSTRSTFEVNAAGTYWVEVMYGTAAGTGCNLSQCYLPMAGRFYQLPLSGKQAGYVCCRGKGRKLHKQR
jgi:hypothetical protein